MTVLLPGLIAGLAAVSGLAQQPVSATPMQTGARACLPECQDPSGQVIEWSEFEGKALVILFHADDADYSRKALDLLVRGLFREEDLRSRLALVVVLRGEAGQKRVGGGPELAGVPFRVATDPGHKAFAPYRVIAYPTAYCIGADRRVNHVLAGYGPHFAFQIIAASRFGAGLIDRETFQELLSGRRPEGATTQEKRLARRLQMVKRLAAGGRHLEARGRCELAAGAYREALLRAVLRGL